MEALLHADVRLFWLVNSWHAPFLDLLAPIVTQLGNGWLLIPAAMALVGFAYGRRAAAPLFVCLAAFAVAGLTNNLLKRTIDRPRPVDFFAQQGEAGRPTPSVHVVGAPLHGRAFPSGHTNMAFAGATLLTALRGRRFWLAFVGAGLVGWTRIYLAAHFPLDVLAGAVIGSGVALVAVVAARSHGLHSPGARPVE